MHIRFCMTNLHGALLGMLDRPRHLAAIRRLLRNFQAVAAEFGKRARLFDLETDRDLRLLQDPEPVLAPLRGFVVIDEVQRLPSLFPPLRPLLDRRPIPARFLLLGSASPSVATRGSESLAGRIAY